MGAIQETPKRKLGPILLVVLIAAVGGGIYWSNRAQVQQAITSTVQEKALVRGVVGSEKMPFFSDARVQARLAELGLSVTVEKHGSREIAFIPNLKDYDFAFPAGEPAAVKIQEVTGKKQFVVPFYTVMAVASWKPIVKILTANGFASELDGHYYLSNLKGFLEASASGKRWKDLKDSSAYAISRSLLISSTDARKSNSAAMYLSLASYIFNGEQVVETDYDVQKVLPQVAPLFRKQGLQENSSLGPYEDYKLIGMGKAPLVMIYEANYIEDLIAKTPLNNADQMLLLYPQPTVYTKQVFIPMSPAGERLGAALNDDPALQKLAATFGWRPRQVQAQNEVWAAAKVPVPAQIVDVINPPRYEIVEALIGGIEATE